MEIHFKTQNQYKENYIQITYDKFLEDESILKAIHKLHKTNSELQTSKYHLKQISILHKDRIDEIQRAKINISGLIQQYQQKKQQTLFIKKELERLQLFESQLKKDRYKIYSDMQIQQNKLQILLENIENMNPNTSESLKSLITMKMENEALNEKIINKRQQLTEKKLLLEKIQKEKVQAQQECQEILKTTRMPSKQANSKMQMLRQGADRRFNINIR